MPRIVFTPNLERHLACPPVEVRGETVRASLLGAFADHPRLEGYLLDDQGELRKHVMVFLDGRQLRGSEALATRVEPGSEIYVMQALSGG